MLIVLVLENHVLIASVEHDLLGTEKLAFGSLNLRDVGDKFKLVVRAAFEHSDFGAADDEGAVVPMSHCELRVDGSVLVFWLSCFIFL
jgi:hypothetical protein